jgi:hypothetical protein
VAAPEKYPDELRARAVRLYRESDPKPVIRRGIHQPVPVHLPVHDKVCTRHGIWLSDVDQPHLDLAACPEIITAQHRRANRLLRRYTAQQLTLAHQAATKAIPAWPASPAVIPFHWRHRLLILQTTNHRGSPTDHGTYTHAAIYPGAITWAALTLLDSSRPHTFEQEPLAQFSGSRTQRRF